MRLLPILVLFPLILGAAQPVKLVLPTDNRALFEDKPEDFYMYVNEGLKRWTTGQYGFVRSVREVENDGIIATKFHEGLDIKPVKRDHRGVPLDKVRAIADGTVAYVNNNRIASNYGIYIVIEHNWGHGPLYSLYAHLADTSVIAGQKVKANTNIGTLGFTGRGINLRRAHLHLELCLLNNKNYDSTTDTKHGIYDGRNLIGIDLANLYLALRTNPNLTIPQFLKTLQPYFKVTIPRDKPLEITQRYPWLKKGDHSKSTPSYEISFSASGIPLAVNPSRRDVTQPTITAVRLTRSNHEYYTRGRLTGTGRRATLKPLGKLYLSLFMNDFPIKPKETQPETIPTE